MTSKTTMRMHEEADWMQLRLRGILSVEASMKEGEIMQLAGT